MNNRQLPLDLVSLFGRNLQLLLGDQFTESFLNKILRLLMNTPSIVTRSRAWPFDTVIYPYRVSIFSGNYKKNFNDFMKARKIGLKEKIFLIKVILIYEKSYGTTNRLSFDQEIIFEMLESVLFYLKNNVQLFYADLMTPPLKEKTKKALISLIAGVVHFVNPSALLFTNELQFTNDRCWLNELNKFILEKH